MTRGYRQKALEEYGDECAVCGREEDVVHHRDGDRTNNQLSNLVPLCYRCHGKAHAGDKDVPELARDLGKVPTEREYRCLQISDELADELFARKQRGDTYEDVIRRMLDAPNEYRIDCDECGFDGGTYDSEADPDPPSHCPKCGEAR